MDVGQDESLKRCLTCKIVHFTRYGSSRCMDLGDQGEFEASHHPFRCIFSGIWYIVTLIWCVKHVIWTCSNFYFIRIYVQLMSRIRFYIHFYVQSSGSSCLCICAVIWRVIPISFCILSCILSVVSITFGILWCIWRLTPYISSIAWSSIREYEATEHVLERQLKSTPHSIASKTVNGTQIHGFDLTSWGGTSVYFDAHSRTLDM